METSSVCLKDISPRAWEHPADRAALAALKKIPGVSQVMKTLLGATSEKAIRLVYLGSAVKVRGNQFPRVSLLFRQVAETLDCQELPEIFVKQDPALNAAAIGVDRPFIVINSAMLSALNDAELSAVLAHELGHILSGHGLYKTVLQLLTNVSFYLLPLSRALITPVYYALREWDRMSELTADRAGLLGMQNKTASCTLLMKLAGGNHMESMDLDDFLLQAAEYETNGDALDGLFRLTNTLNRSHPFAVSRLKELKTWSDSRAYQTILAGDYPRRGGADAPVFEDLGEAHSHYTRRFSTGGFGQGLKHVGDGFSGLASGVTSAMRDVFGGSDDDQAGD